MAFQHQTIRCFENETEYNQVADATLDSLQDAIDDAMDNANQNVEYEISLASGVLTIALPPHGTWVINKQTPNRQLWWSSPLSGPKRFEYHDELWLATNDGLSLAPLLTQELQHVLKDVLPRDFEINL